MGVSYFLLKQDMFKKLSASTLPSALILFKKVEKIWSVSEILTTDILGCKDP